MREIAIIAERYLAEQEIADLIEPVGFDDLAWFDNVAERFGDLFALIGPTSRGRIPASAVLARLPSGMQASKPRENAEYPCPPLQIGGPELRI